MSPEARPTVGPIPPGRDPDSYDRMRRRVLWMLPTGLYVVGSRHQARCNLMTISWVTQVAITPKLIGIGVESTSFTHELISGGRVFALSVLGREARTLVRRFAKPVQDVALDEAGRGIIEDAAVHRAVTGAPILDVAVAWLDCEVRHELALGSHTWFVGEVMDCDAVSPGPEPSPADGHHLVEVLRMEDTRMNYGG
jgi:flavin reductase (DIM6/NTAB) family NADH-FMN oxidoreductase RutF